jgi:hypothetical protein
MINNLMEKIGDRLDLSLTRKLWRMVFYKTNSQIVDNVDHQTFSVSNSIDQLRSHIIIKCRTTGRNKNKNTNT